MCSSDLAGHAALESVLESRSQDGVYPATKVQVPVPTSQSSPSEFTSQSSPSASVPVPQVAPTAVATPVHATVLKAHVAVPVQAPAVPVHPAGHSPKADAHTVPASVHVAGASASRRVCPGRMDGSAAARVTVSLPSSAVASMAADKGAAAITPGHGLGL